MGGGRGAPPPRGCSCNDDHTLIEQQLFYHIGLFCQMMYGAIQLSPVVSFDIHSIQGI